jgi:tetratricopeptide (TPR) repeat protein
MDCRRTLLLALGLLSGAAGCQLPSTGAPLTPPTVRKAEEDKKVKMPSTFVAYGEMMLKSSATQPAAQQQEFREGARKAFQQALELDPKYLPAHLALAQLFTDAGDHVRAAAAFQKAVEVNDKDRRSSGRWSWTRTIASTPTRWVSRWRVAGAMAKA